jgi:adenylosuccinate lyase
METELKAISAIDGRYKYKTQELTDFFSEYALFKYRIQVEIEYFIFLSQLKLTHLKSFKSDDYKSLLNIYDNFNVEECKKIKAIEQTTNHDVKAVEYYIQEKFDELNLSKYKSYIHFALTSQDINTTSVMLSLKEATQQVMIPQIENILTKLTELADKWKYTKILSLTHGQPATLSTMGQQLKVFFSRLYSQLTMLKKYEYRTKLGGAVGNLHAHYQAFPNINWDYVLDNWVYTTFDMTRYHHTTQISHYDELAELFDIYRRINTILVDLNIDMWLYISNKYFKLKINKNEVGSSTMPHKVNPIDFENSEGNLLYASHCLDFLSKKLPVSRLQRDLTDSTLLRNLGDIFGHILIGYKSASKGLSKIEIDADSICKKLDEHPEIMGETIQTILRKHGYQNSYELVKKFTRTTGTKNMNKFIQNLDIPTSIKEEICNLLW